MDVMTEGQPIAGSPLGTTVRKMHREEGHQEMSTDVFQPVKPELVPVPKPGPLPASKLAPLPKVEQKRTTALGPSGGAQIEEQQALLNKLWDQLHVPEDARAKFYRGIPDLYSEEGLQTLTEEVRRLEAMLLSSKKVIKLVLTRKEFIKRMLEFEVLASDPKRLFKNSAILNKEEQFRRSAYPTLLDLEDQIRQALTEFENETGQPFMWEGQYYLLTLEAEVDERPMDPTVFGVGQGKTMKTKIQQTKLEAAKQKIPAAGAAKAAAARTAAAPPRAAATRAPAPPPSAATARTAGKTAPPPPATGSKARTPAPPPGFKSVKR